MKFCRKWFSVRRFCLGILCLFMLCLLPAGCGLSAFQRDRPDTGTGYTVVDAQGTEIYIPHKPKRILAGNLSYDTMLLGLTTADHLAAVNQLDRDPMSSFIAEDAKSVKMTVKSLTGLPLETVMKSRPDVIIVPDWTSRNDIDMFRSLGYPVIVGKGPDSMEDVRQDILLMGKVLGEEERSRKVIAEMDRQMEEIDAVMNERKEDWPVGLLVSQMTSWGGPGSIFDELTTKARVKNGIAEAGLINGQELTKESVLKADPDFFLVSAYPNGNMSSFQKEWFHDPALQHMKGIHRIVPLPNRYLYCASQNMPYAIKAVVNAGYGPVFDLSDEHLIRGY